jgi:sirohydrochlorin cobaltochelatase
MRNLTRALADWLASGGREMGEIHIEQTGKAFVLLHRDDARAGDNCRAGAPPAAATGALALQSSHPQPGLTDYTGAEAARELAHFDEHGKFRPLKTAPNLRHGWRLTVADLAALRRAVDYFYPAMLGIWLSHRRGELVAVPLRDTLARQTGMYAVTKKISDAQAQAMVSGFCRTDGGCLKQILWPLAPGVPITSLPAEKFRPEAPPGAMPFLCQEACNLLVAKAREVVKKGEMPE